MKDKSDPDNYFHSILLVRHLEERRNRRERERELWGCLFGCLLFVHPTERADEVAPVIRLEPTCSLFVSAFVDF